MSKDYEYLTETSEPMIYVVVKIMLLNKQTGGHYRPSCEKQHLPLRDEAPGEPQIHQHACSQRYLRSQFSGGESSKAGEPYRTKCWPLPDVSRPSFASNS